MDFLQVRDKNYLITGVANKKSVAFHSAKVLQEAGANLFFSAQNDKNREQIKKHFPNDPVVICDVEKQGDIDALVNSMKNYHDQWHGMLHSIAFANFVIKENRPAPFHETPVNDYLQASHISCFSLVTLSNSLKDLLIENASVVTISISDTKATSYGYMGPIKAALNSTIGYLAKSVSEEKNIRFNAVCSGPLKTSASAGIPNYIENYLYAQQMTLRKKSLQTSEVADTVAFLLSPRSSGLNASEVLVDAGMSVNHFDQALVQAFAKLD